MLSRFSSRIGSVIFSKAFSIKWHSFWVISDWYNILKFNFKSDSFCNWVSKVSLPQTVHSASRNVFDNVSLQNPNSIWCWRDLDSRADGNCDLVHAW